MMLNFLDVVLEPTPEVVEPVAKSAPWIAAYVVVGALVCVAVFFVIKKIFRAKK